mmetsp:Transcript_15092/g.42913  ORF Transcript_15092/g.42913 Transcript_15092/m.42913 type:complete len:200 (-) Transcript_15092:53-652(-)
MRDRKIRVTPFCSRDGYGVANRELCARLIRDSHGDVQRVVRGVVGVRCDGVLAVVEVALVDEGRRAGGALERAAPAHLATHARHAFARIHCDCIPFRALIAIRGGFHRAASPVRSGVDDIPLGKVDAAVPILIPHWRPVSCGRRGSRGAVPQKRHLQVAFVLGDAVVAVEVVPGPAGRVVTLAGNSWKIFDVCRLGRRL